MANFMATVIKLTEARAATGRPCPSLTASALSQEINLVWTNLKSILRARCLVSPGLSLLKRVQKVES